MARNGSSAGTFQYLHASLDEFVIFAICFGSVTFPIYTVSLEHSRLLDEVCSNHLQYHDYGHLIDRGQK